MKELTIEEKAKCYDEALERARIWQNHLYETMDKGDRDYADELNYIFPELKESRGERIMKNIIIALKSQKDELEDFYKSHNTSESELVAWLEKQGMSYNKMDIDDAYLKGMSDTKNEIEKQYEATYQIRKDIATFIFNYRGDIKDRAKWMNYLGIKVSIVEKQGEQKHNKVEPKFNVGDWITDGNSVLHITNMDYGFYQFEDSYDAISIIDKNYHLWTIKDAKPGDILVDKDNNIGIYRKEKDNFWESYIYLGCNHYLYGDNIGGYHEHKNTEPATKKQRDLLFKKMKEANYEWNAEKKELKKIEQESIWSEEDEEFLRRAINTTQNNYPVTANWLKSLKQRIRG